MSFSSNPKTSHSERRTATENGSTRPRGPTAHQGGSKTDRTDLRQPSSPQYSTAGSTHKRTVSGSQRNKVVDERRTERVQVTTRETLTSRTKSPERRNGPPPAQERTRPREPTRTPSVDNRPRSSRTETPQSTYNSRDLYAHELMLL